VTDGFAHPTGKSNDRRHLGEAASLVVAADGVPFSTTYVASSAAFPSPTFLTE
jgi:hypothetical protein